MSTFIKLPHALLRREVQMGYSSVAFPHGLRKINVDHMSRATAFFTSWPQKSQSRLREDAFRIDLHSGAAIPLSS